MNTISRIMTPLQRAFVVSARARVNTVLLGMGRERVEEFGYSFDALRLGPDAWPWQKTPQDRAEEKELQAHVRYLKTCTDRQLNDIGIARNGIEKAVRLGRPGIERKNDAA